MVQEIFHAIIDVMNSVFHFTQETIGAQSHEIKKLLVDFKFEQYEVQNTLLLLEEAAVRLYGSGARNMNVRVSRFFGIVRLVLTAEGEPCNPLESTQSSDIEDEDYLRDVIFQAHKNELSYSRKNSLNILTITPVRAKKGSMRSSVVAMLLGIVFGLLLREMPVSAAGKFDGMLSAVQDLFMNALSFVIAPVVFFSVVTSLARLSNGKEIGRIGSKIVLSHLFMTIVAISLGFALGSLFFKGNISEEAVSMFADSDVQEQTQITSIKDLFLEIIPKDIISPFMNGDLMQILFISLIVGIAMNALGEKSAGLLTWVEEGNAVFMRILTMVLSFMPFVAFSAIALVVYKTDILVLLLLLRYVLCVIIGCAVLLVFFLLSIAIMARISPVPFFKKLMKFIPIALIITKRNALLPVSTEFCSKQLGVSEKLSAFTLSLGATINKCSGCLIIAVELVMFAKMCNFGETGCFDIKTMLHLAPLIFMFMLGSNGVVCLLAILPVVGIPTGCIAFTIGVEVIVQRLRNSTGLSGDLAACVIVAKSENELNQEAYKG